MFFSNIKRIRVLTARIEKEIVMADVKWYRVASINELKEQTPKKIEVKDKTIMLIRKSDDIFALEHSCPHYGAPLSDGIVRGNTLTCPWHNAAFDVSSGTLLLPPSLDHLQTYPVKKENGEVYIRLEALNRPKKRGLKSGKTFVIAGGGAAGTAAAITLRDEGFDGKIFLISREEDLPYDRPLLSKDFLSGEANPDYIPLRKESFYRDNSIDLLQGIEVTDIRPGDREVVVSGNKTIGFDRLLLATGGIPRTFGIPGVSMEGVFVLRSLADARRITEALSGVEEVGIVGAGFIGMEAAASLTKRGLTVHVIAPEALPLMPVFGETAGRWFKKIHERHNVRFHLGKTAKRFIGGHSVRGIELSDGSSIDCRCVILGLGIDPAVSFIANTPLVENGAVPVTEKLETKIPGIYAAGDIACLRHPITGENQRVEHWAVAERQGKAAAHAMLAQPVVYDEPPFFWTKQYEYPLTYTGYTSGEVREAVRGTIEEDRFLIGYYAGDTLKACLSCETDKEFMIMQRMIKAGKPVPYEAFENPEFIPADG